MNNWFQTARLGMFTHWEHSSQQGWELSCILISDRLPNCGDFETPEQFIPHQPPAHPWQTCLTINESWGYNSSDCNFKTSRQLIHT